MQELHRTFVTLSLASACSGSKQARAPSPEQSEHSDEDPSAQEGAAASGSDEADSHASSEQQAGSDTEEPTQSGCEAPEAGKAVKRSYAQMVADSVDDASLRGACHYAGQCIGISVTYMHPLH